MNPETAIRKKHHSAGYHVQTVVAVLITIVMLFPLYWMLATSVKSAGHSYPVPAQLPSGELS